MRVKTRKHTGIGWWAAGLAAILASSVPAWSDQARAQGQWGPNVYTQFYLTITAETSGGDQTYELPPLMGGVQLGRIESANGFHTATMALRGPDNVATAAVVECSLTGVDNPDYFQLFCYVDQELPDDVQFGSTYGSIYRTAAATVIVNADVDANPTQGVVLGATDQHTITFTDPPEE